MESQRRKIVTTLLNKKYERALPFTDPLAKLWNDENATGILETDQLVSNVPKPNDSVNAPCSLYLRPVHSKCRRQALKTWAPTQHMNVLTVTKHSSISKLL